ncbi:cytidine deaminase [Shewanella yunxiaonensis]|uniref:Cytidine deaminase n=1 Tax=Shewanella yunxiaonensis TaxID=2829809 RepID=A0ABX7YQ12_9GAMM|nr:cytidine deaminase [Shewanella yunxiaonensis]QUN04598.1 cytidine deaminase [Shewanella yunxiaonensis]
MQDRFLNSLQQLPSSLSTVLVPLLGKDFAGHFDAQQLAHLQHASGMDESQLLSALLPIAAAMSLAPVSDFYVGAIAKGQSGAVYMGANMELAGEALCHSVHAEQNAISHAWLCGEVQVTDIWVNASPCGHCRQFMNELVAGGNICIHLPQQPPATLTHYLPYGFGPKDLGVVLPLLAKQQVELTLESSDPMVIEGLDHASLSYAPYSQSYSAVVLEMVDGVTFCGRYAENAAFNPSMMPMQMALASLIRHNRDFSDIKRAMLLESSAGKLSLVDMSMDALHAVANVELEYVVVAPL